MSDENRDKTVLYIQNITKLRISAHRLPIETGRYERPIVPRDKRYCKICTKSGLPDTIGDENHLLFQCTIGSAKRSKLLGELKDAIDSSNASALFNLTGKDLVRLGIYANNIYSDYLQA